MMAIKPTQVLSVLHKWYQIKAWQVSLSQFRIKVGLSLMSVLQGVIHHFGSILRGDRTFGVTVNDKVTQLYQHLGQHFMPILVL